MENINHKVFINDTVLYFVNVYDADALTKLDGKIVSSAKADVKEVIAEIEWHPSAARYYYLSDNADASWQVFLSYYTLIEASGGLVQNDKGEYLVIFRRGRWDLPKGKVEYAESPEEAAVREVEEECGVQGLKITKPLPLTFHTYSLKKKPVLKKTHWYLMQYSGKGKLTPQTEEDIEKAEWMNLNELKTVFFDNTYQSIKEFLNEVIS